MGAIVVQEITDDLGARWAERLRACAEPLADGWTKRLAAQGSSDLLLVPVAPQALRALATAVESRSPFNATPFAEELRGRSLLRRLQGVTVTALLDELATLHALVVHALRDVPAGDAPVLEPALALSTAWQGLVQAFVSAHTEQALSTTLDRGEALARYTRRLNHDLRNHLYALQMHLRLMQEDRIVLDPERRADLLARAREATSGLTHLAPSLLSSTIQEELAAQGEPASLDRVLQGAITLAGPWAQERGVALRIEGEVPEEPVAAELLLGALLELIGHSLFSEPPAHAVVLRTRLQGDMAVEIEHQGDSKHPDQLFGVGSRVWGRRAEEPAGLWVARQLVEAMGARLEAHATPEGARFRILLPVSSR